MVFEPEAVETDAFAAADNNFWHDVRDTGTLIWDTKSFIDAEPEIVGKLCEYFVLLYLTNCSRWYS